MASLVARLPVLREELQRAQREIGSQSSLVAEGRDMGTCVFPSAPYKFFLDARPEVRARRRYLELEARGSLNGETEEDILKAIQARDQQDRNRVVDPLRPADDAIIVDTSDLDLDGVMHVLLETVASGKSQSCTSSEDMRRARTELHLPLSVLEQCVSGVPGADVLTEARMAGLMAARAASSFLPLRPQGEGALELHCRVERDMEQIVLEAEVSAGPMASLRALVAVQAAAAAVCEIILEGGKAEIRTFLS